MIISIKIIVDSKKMLYKLSANHHIDSRMHLYGFTTRILFMISLLIGYN